MRSLHPHWWATVLRRESCGWGLGKDLSREASHRKHLSRWFLTYIKAIHLLLNFILSSDIQKNIPPSQAKFLLRLLAQVRRTSTLFLKNLHEPSANFPVVQSRWSTWFTSSTLYPPSQALRPARGPALLPVTAAALVPITVPMYALASLPMKLVIPSLRLFRMVVTLALRWERAVLSAGRQLALEAAITTIGLAEVAAR